MRIYEGGIQRILGVVVNIRAGKKNSTSHREKYVTTNLDRNSMKNKKHSQTVSPRKSCTPPRPTERNIVCHRWQWRRSGEENWKINNKSRFSLLHIRPSFGCMLGVKNRKSKISLSQAQLLCCWLDTQETISHALSPKDLCKLWMARKEFTLILHVKWTQRVSSSQQKKSAHKTWKNPPEKSHVFHTGRKEKEGGESSEKNTINLVSQNNFSISSPFFLFSSLL